MSEPQIWPDGAEIFRASTRYKELKKKVPTIDQLLKDNGAVIAGGAVLLSIINDDNDKSDIDIYIPCTSYRNFSTIVTTQIMPIAHQHMYKASEYCRSFLRKNGIRSVHSILIKLDKKNQYLGVDLMAVRNRRNILSVVQNFDLTFCQIWFDGENVWSTHPEHIRNRSGILQQDYVPMMLSGNKFLKNRMEKYASRGFTITLDATVNDDFFKNITYNMTLGHRNPCWHPLDVEDETTRRKWALKLMFKAALGTFPEYFEAWNTGSKSTYRSLYIKDENGYDSDDYVEQPKKLWELRDKTQINLSMNQLYQDASTILDGTHGQAYLDILEKEILKFVNINISAKKWQGYTQSNIEIYDGFLHEVYPEDGRYASTTDIDRNNEYVISFCPLCLKVVEHLPGTCMYVSHKCDFSVKLSPIYSRFTRNKYSTWCTTCGRACYDHSHYKLMNSEEASDRRIEPEIIPSGAPFESDCRQTSGGGGRPEKIKRVINFRRKALELNAQINAITHEEALVQLIKAAWDGPFEVTDQEAQETLDNKQFLLSSDEFGERKHNAESNVHAIISYPDAGNPDLMPIVHEHATNTIKNAYFADDANIIQFRHRMPNGTINNHSGDGQQISKAMFITFLQSFAENRSQKAFGMCWKYPECKARLYPDEVKAVLDLTDEAEKHEYELYAEEFNRKFSHNYQNNIDNDDEFEQRGGDANKNATAVGNKVSNKAVQHTGGSYLQSQQKKPQQRKTKSVRKLETQRPTRKRVLEIKFIKSKKI
jgi:hypothetical protein